MLLMSFLPLAAFPRGGYSSVVGNSARKPASLGYQLGRNVQPIVSDFKGSRCPCMRLAFSSIDARKRVLFGIACAEVWRSRPVSFTYVDRCKGEFTMDAPKIHRLSVL